MSRFNPVGFLTSQLSLSGFSMLFTLVTNTRLFRHHRHDVCHRDFDQKGHSAHGIGVCDFYNRVAFSHIRLSVPQPAAVRIPYKAPLLFFTLWPENVVVPNKAHVCFVTIFRQYDRNIFGPHFCLLDLGNKEIASRSEAPYGLSF